MARNDNTTRPTAAAVDEFVDGVAHAKRRTDTRAAIALAREVTGEQPVMWGASIIGFGSYHYRYPTGREGDFPRVALSPRRDALTFYGLRDAPVADTLLERLGPHTEGKGCVYLRDLDAVDGDVLRELLALAWSYDRSVTRADSPGR